MSYGLQVLNNTLGLQIDGNSQQYALVSKGVVGNVGVATQPQYWSFTHNSAANPMMALRATNCHASVEYVRKDGNQYTFMIYCVKASAGAYINWYMFDIPSLGRRGSGYGLEVYNEGGTTIVSDEYPLLKIVDVLSGGNVNYNTSYAGGRTYAQITNSGLWSNWIIEVGDSLTQAPQYIRTYAMGGWRWDGTSILTETNGSTQPHAYRGFDDYSGGPSALIIADVTNL
jgi:hypothetical protein